METSILQNRDLFPEGWRGKSATRDDNRLRASVLRWALGIPKSARWTYSHYGITKMEKLLKRQQELEVLADL